MEYRGTIEGLKNIVRKAGYEIIEPKFTQHVSHNLLHQIEISEGGVIIWHEGTGIISIFSRKIIQEKLEKALAKHIEEKSKTASHVSKPLSPEIFIVHGHDSAALKDLKLVLYELGLKPYILQDTSGNGLTIIEALEKEICKPTRSIKFGIVLLTPDDMGYSRTAGTTAAPRARQNVILEMGMLISALSRKNVAILIKQDVEIPSDVHGIIYLPFKDHVKKTVPKLVDRLIESGFTLDPAAISRALN
ncbi:TIR domain-containing protein [Bartonella refiksaydamii]|uniref:TIR domain-containing protein n=1 Tax=Bartonella refiksaydamii TaxID=2654951 RepID=UPI0012EC74AB|nr:nucleotide-binding protein [Bartonella refiksaydamii]